MKALDGVPTKGDFLGGEQCGNDGNSQHVSAQCTHRLFCRGSNVLEGVGSYVVVTVGMKSFNGKTMMGASLQSLAPRTFILNS